MWRGEGVNRVRGGVARAKRRVVRRKEEKGWRGERKRMNGWQGFEVWRGW